MISIVEITSMKYFFPIVIVIIFMLAFGSYLLGKYTPSKDLVTELTNNIQQQVDLQYKGRLDELQKALEDKDQKLQDVQIKYNTIVVKLAKLAKEKANVAKPKDSVELIDRLNALGLKPTVR